ncbi:hypothetical protein [Streptomyces sp. WP-1]|uniref:hypothetical protein n=1 Tax=Streptomyces sp. WP-1 TaxID=3041497 RepID=UPI00264845D7|nr:hypothetical protein [Streptomyces sp. WP-1]WKE68283.1 hypothetical protein QHG49_04210 [Streptomyces sp. WP-1]
MASRMVLIAQAVPASSRSAAADLPAVVVHGGGRIGGQVRVAGHKHSMVAAFAATLALGVRATLTGVPQVTERDVLLEQLELLGCTWSVEGDQVVLDATAARPAPLSARLTRKIHGSLYLLPAMLARFGEVEFPGAGGDQLGDFEMGQGRPFLHLLEMLERFGCRFEVSADGSVHGRRDRRLCADVELLDWSDDPRTIAGSRMSSVTKAALLLAAATDGTSRLRHPLVLWSTQDLMSFLGAAGVGVAVDPDGGAVTIRGRGPGHGRAAAQLAPDCLESVTWAACAVATGGTVEIRTGAPDRMRRMMHHELAALAQLGVQHEWEGDRLTVTGDPGTLRPADLVARNATLSTDALPLYTTVMMRAPGRSSVSDLVWPGRYAYAEHLGRVGVPTSTTGAGLTVVGGAPLRPADAPLTPGDTRSGAVALITALAAPGRTEVHGLDHVHRGYADMLGKLTALGAGLTPCPVPAP